MVGIREKISEIINNDKNFATGLAIMLFPFLLYTISIVLNLVTIIYWNTILISFDFLNKLFPAVLACFTVGYAIILFQSKRFEKRSAKESILLFNKNRYVAEEQKRITEIFEDILKISPEKRRQIIDVLKERNANLPCPSCGNTTFSILDGYFIHTLVFSEDTKVQNDMPVVPAIIVMCNRCGHLSQHSIKKLGLLPDAEEKNGN